MKIFTTPPQNNILAFSVHGSLLALNDKAPKWVPVQA